jgi:hypothetical protein
MSILAKGAALVALLLGVVVPAAVQVLAQAELGQWEMPAGAVAGKTAIVTGANSGLGLETARVLAAGGAEVVMGCRREDRCRAAMEEIRRQHPAAKLKMGLLDLADEKSVRRFAKEFLASHDKLHMLINNAAIMARVCVQMQNGGGGGGGTSQYADSPDLRTHTHHEHPHALNHAQSTLTSTHAYSRHVCRPQTLQRSSGRAERSKTSLPRTTSVLSSSRGCCRSKL